MYIRKRKRRGSNDVCSAYFFSPSSALTVQFYKCGGRISFPRLVFTCVKGSIRPNFIPPMSRLSAQMNNVENMLKTVFCVLLKTHDSFTCSL